MNPFEPRTEPELRQQSFKGNSMKSLNTSPSAIKQTLQRALAFVFTLVIAFAGFLVPEAPFVPAPIPAADAQTPTTNSQYKFGDCSFRKGTGEAATLANSLCFLDWTGFDLTKSNGTAPPASKAVTKTIGRYTVTFTMKLKSDEDYAFPRLVGAAKPSFQPEKPVYNNKHNNIE